MARYLISDLVGQDPLLQQTQEEPEKTTGTYRIEDLLAEPPKAYSAPSFSDIAYRRGEAIGDIWRQAGQDVTQLKQDWTEDKFKGMPAGGQVATWELLEKGLISPVAATALEEVKGLSQAVLPSFIEEPIVNTGIDVMKGAMELVEKSDWLAPVLNKAKESYTSYLDWKNSSEKNAQLARSLEAHVDLGILLAPPTKVSPFIGGDKLSELGNSIIRRGTRQVVGERKQTIQDMLEPWDLEKDVPIQEINESSILRLRQKQWQPPEADPFGRVGQETISVVSLIPTINPSRSFTYNAKMVQNEIESTANRLKTRISSKGNPQYDKDTFINQLEKEIDDLVDSPEFEAMGGTAATGKSMRDGILGILRDSDNNALSLLEARQLADSLVLKQKPLGYGESFHAYANAKNQIFDLLRRRMNDQLSEIVPDVSVKDLLRKQHLLYKGRDVFWEKSHGEGRHLLSQIINRVQRVSGVKMSSAFLSVAATGSMVGGLMASGIMPSLAGAGALTAGTYIAGRVLTSGKAKQALGGLLASLNQAIKKSESSAMIEQLKADRLALIAYMNQREKDEKEGIIED